jgi:hypothetical protein
MARLRVRENRQGNRAEAGEPGEDGPFLGGRWPAIDRFGRADCCYTITSFYFLAGSDGDRRFEWGRLGFGWVEKHLRAGRGEAFDERPIGGWSFKAGSKRDGMSFG